MPIDHAQPFTIGVTRDVRNADGSLTFVPTADLAALEIAGVEWAFLAEDARPLTPELLHGIDGLYHFSPPLTAASLDDAVGDRLVIVARHGVGLDFIDVDACTERGIVVTITPAGVTRPMASAAAALVLSLAHRLRERDDAFHRGDWAAGRFQPTGMGLSGRTLGVVGYGRIGREIVRLLEPWQMRVLVSQRTPVAEPDVTYVPLDTLLAESDVVVLACPLTPETRGMLDDRRLRLLKPTAFLVNVARGGLVHQAALVDALRNGRLAGAGVDVVDPEPLPADDPLLELPNVVGAPHSLGYTDELVRGCVGGVCSALLDVAAGRTPADVVNPDVLDSTLFLEKVARLEARRGGTR